MMETRFTRAGTLLVAAMTLAVFFTGTARVPVTSKLAERGITIPIRAIEKITTTRPIAERIRIPSPVPENTSNPGQAPEGTVNPDEITEEKAKNPDQTVGKNWDVRGGDIQTGGIPEPIRTLKDTMAPSAPPAPNELGEIEVPASGPGFDPVNDIL